MLAHLHSFDIFLWFAIAAAQASLSILLMRRHTGQRYPAFCTYVHFSALTTLFLMAIPSRMPWTIFWSYYAISVIACVLMAVVLGELYMKTFGPSIALPAWVPRNVKTWLMAAVSSCAVLAFALKPLGAHRYLVTMGAIQAALVSALLISLIVLMIYSRHLGIMWRPWPQRIAIGFLLFLGVNAIAKYALGLTSRETAEVVRRVGQMAYFVSLAWWGFTLWGKEPVPEKATTEQVNEMLRIHGATMDEAEQLFTQVLIGRRNL